ncbi:cyclic nucleotide-binding/CBS domain-containing protein [Elstera cyanobacteriorum]|uniref:CBS domain-containing protein n=1 Tax=Elstera cyanobacteriorum TaxID=2022747 RepID=UPI002354BDAA|nr:CBS domain-containing protein [Elstera cyanobacteriorum]MCK6441315.1 CBS domain-containing protein [Elstera cyanobacteriorum]
MKRTLVPGIVSETQAFAPLSPQQSVQEAAEMMADRRIGAAMVVEQGRLVGIFSERDLLSRVVAQGRNPATTKVADVMTLDPHTLPPDASPREALTIMEKGKFRHLPIVDGDDIVAIISIRDLFAAVNAELTKDLEQRDSLLFGAGYGG